MAETLRGVRILLRLRLHHTKARVTQLLYATGTDFSEDTSLMDRWYQLYVVLVLLVTFILTWAYLLDLAEGIGATLGVPGASTLLGLLWVLPLVVCVTSVVHYLRTPSVPLTHPDIELLSGVLTPAAWVVASAVPVLLRSVVLGLIGGRLMGAVLQAVVSPVALTLAVAVALVLAVALGWACGLARLMRLVPHPCFDRASIVQSNALYADLQSMTSWAAQAPITYEEQRRRRILAGRRPILSLPQTTGARLLVARALLSHLRQREGLKDLMEWGAFLVPAGAVLVASSADLGLRLMWMTLGSLSLGRARELTRVFRDDCRVRLVGDAIACSRTLFRLLLLDSLPAVAFTVLLGLVVVACLSLPFSPIASSACGAPGILSMLVITLSLVATLLFAGGIDVLSRRSARARPDFLLLAFFYLLGVGGLSLVGPLWAACGGCTYAVALAGICVTDARAAQEPLR